METPDTSRIDQPWPAADLERIECCPYCDARERTVAHREVQDWSCYAAPGKWTYWTCTRCSSLYLSPRPTAATLGHAYRTYHTHQLAQRESFLQGVKDRLVNECWSHWLAIDLLPRLRLPRHLNWL